MGAPTVTDDLIDACGFRMFELHEIARTMQMRAVPHFTAACHQSLVIPYQSSPHTADEPVRTITTRDRLALIVPPSTNGTPRDAYTEPSFVQVTETRPSLLEVPE